MTLAIVLAAGARPAHACDPTESPNCSDASFLATPATFGMVTAGSVGLAGLITAVGGAANPRSKGWRNANYVIGTLSLVESTRFQTRVLGCLIAGAGMTILTQIL